MLLRHVHEECIGPNRCHKFDRQPLRCCTRFTLPLHKVVQLLSKLQFILHPTLVFLFFLSIYVSVLYTICITWEILCQIISLSIRFVKIHPNFYYVICARTFQQYNGPILMKILLGLFCNASVSYIVV